MTIEPVMIFWLLAGLIFILAGQLAVAVWALWSLSRRLAEVKRQEQHLKDGLAAKEEEILEKAREKGQKIVAQAFTAAVRIQKEAKIDKEKLIQLISQKLEQASAGILKSYQGELEKVGEDNIRIFKNVSKDITTQTSQAMAEELKRRQQEHFRKLDEQIIGLLKEVSQKVLGKALPLEAHQDLIIEALEKAKKERIFK